jgi:hypothetical protein
VQEVILEESEKTTKRELITHDLLQPLEVMDKRKQMQKTMSMSALPKQLNKNSINTASHGSLLHNHKESLLV